MVPGKYIAIGDGKIGLIGTDIGSREAVTVFTVLRRLSTMTGQDDYEIVSTSTMGPSMNEPPILDPKEFEPEPPPRKKSWRQQQRELPKFLR